MGHVGAWNTNIRNDMQNILVCTKCANICGRQEDLNEILEKKLLC